MNKKTKQENILILHNIRSVENVGAMFRTADAGGVGKIYITGYTPTPLDRFGRKRKDLAKSALGAEEHVDWEYTKNLNPLITKLKKNSFYIIGIEQAQNSIHFKKLTRQLKGKNKRVFIVGNEVLGIDKKTLKKCDLIVEIPMKGKKESLNVGVALGVVLFSID